MGEMSERGRSQSGKQFLIVSYSLLNSGRNLSKFLCTSNWADVRLTPAQIRYAATDPYVTFLMYLNKWATREE